MKKLFSFSVLLFVLSFAAVSGFAQGETAQTDSTTLIFVRHAEKLDTGDGDRDPELNTAGKARAQSLAQLISEGYEISAIYSTPYKRTMMTAEPLADMLEIEVKNYGFDDPSALLQMLIKENTGKAVLVVGHSNTTPMLVNIVLGEQKYEQLEESDYSNIFIIKTPDLGAGKLTHITY